jgi:hypothetical protein
MLYLHIIGVNKIKVNKIVDTILHIFLFLIVLIGFCGGSIGALYILIKIKLKLIDMYKYNGITIFLLNKMLQVKINKDNIKHFIYVLQCIPPELYLKIEDINIDISASSKTLNSLNIIANNIILIIKFKIASIP